MGFLTGRASWLRFRAGGPAPAVFGEDHLAALARHAAGKIEVGWAAGAHALDVDFALEKQVVHDALCFDLRVDADKPPPDLFKAYYEVELKALAKDNPSGFASAKQKREAKEVAADRLEQEAKDGRFRRRKLIPVLWDRLSNEVLFGAAAATHADRFAALFEQTFDAKLECVTAGHFANHYESEDERVETEMSGRINDDGVSPSAFVPGTSPADVCWIASDDSWDFLGNEFLLWLWYYTDQISDTLRLPDGSEAAVMIARQLVLDCPRGVTGIDGFKTEGPGRLPEAREAVQAGKLPRRAGLTVVRHDRPYEFALHAETLAVGSAKMPNPPEDVTDARAKLEERVTAVRELRAAIDGLYAAFLAVRLTGKWDAELAAVQRWLRRDDRRAA